jgi:hypothetical protein
MPDRVIEELDEVACLQLISRGGIGRIAYVGRFGLVVLPVNYMLQAGALAACSRWDLGPCRPCPSGTSLGL